MLKFAKPSMQRAISWSAAVRHVRPLRVLFVSDHAARLERHLRDLGDRYFSVETDAVRTAREFHQRLRARAYDVIIAEKRARAWTGMAALESLRALDADTPFILVGSPDDETVAECLLSGASDCVDENRLDFLPLAVALAVEGRAAQDERNRVEQELQRARALYDGLVDNSTYGVCQVDASGRMALANDALVALLGYESRQELLQRNLMTDVMSEAARSTTQAAMARTDHLDGLFVDWQRKDGAPIRIRLSGQQVRSGRRSAGGDWELIVEDVTARRDLEDQLRQLAATDPLTGVANRRQLAAAVEGEIKRSERTERQFAVLMLDLDGLKSINDRHGHMAGDRALRRVAGVLLASCRSLDTVARYGGDEFAVVLPETGQEGAAAIVRRIQQGLELQTEAPRLSASVGIAIYPRDGDTIEQLWLTVDRALYGMKKRETRASQGRVTRASSEGR